MRVHWAGSFFTSYFTWFNLVFLWVFKNSWKNVVQDLALTARTIVISFGFIAFYLILYLLRFFHQAASKTGTRNGVEFLLILLFSRRLIQGIISFLQFVCVETGKWTKYHTLYSVCMYVNIYRCKQYKMTKSCGHA